MTDKKGNYETGTWIIFLNRKEKKNYKSIKSNYRNFLKISKSDFLFKLNFKDRLTYFC